MSWDDHREMFGQLESELGTAELSAVLSEWVVAMTHRICAVSSVLGVWRSQMMEHGWTERTVEASLPLIMRRLWSAPNGTGVDIDQIMELISDQIEETLDGDEETDD